MIRVTWAGAAAIIGGSVGIITGVVFLGVAYLIYRAARYVWTTRCKEDRKDGK